MKWIGFLVALLAVWCMRGPEAFAGIAGGTFLILEGYKREIIAAIRGPKPIDNSDLAALRTALARKNDTEATLRD